MAAPDNEFAFDFNATVAAAERWDRHAGERERKSAFLRNGDYEKVESRERLARRANRLLDKVKSAMPATSASLSTGLRELVERDPITEGEIDNALYERVIGETRDFLSSSFLEKGIRAKLSVGRIVRHLDGGRACYGTGFMVSPNLLLTNHHVLSSEKDAAESVVEFDYQVDGDDNPFAIRRFRLDAGKFFLNDPTLDFALIGVTTSSDHGISLAGYRWCPLIGVEGKVNVGDNVNIVQHPRGEMKQIVIRESTLSDLRDNIAQYGGDTEPGSSGSPVFNDQWEVVALHHAGIPKMDARGGFLDINGKPWNRGDDPTLLNWVANEGIRVSRLVEFISKAQVRDHEQALRDELLAQSTAASQPAETKPDVGQPGPVNPPTATQQEIPMSPIEQTTSVTMQSGGITLTIPLTITISLGNAMPRETVPSSSGVTASGDWQAVENTRPIADYGNRPGYNPDFLGFSIPLPKLNNSIKAQAAEVDGPGRYELKYYHYSVMMNKARRLAFVSAVNYDGASKNSVTREGADQWNYDPRIAREYQAGNEFYADNDLDRGHLTRRADSAWGNTPREAQLANDDTFHFTNCSPQHEVFNQPTLANRKGVLLWGNIEEYIAKQAKAGAMKLSIFNGPVMRAGDRLHRGLKIPQEFYKIVVFKQDNGKPRALAFLLSQASLIATLPLEDFQAGPYQPYQVRVRDIESRTSLNFGTLRNFDLLEHDENEAFFESGTDAVSIGRLEDILLGSPVDGLTALIANGAVGAGISEH